jgi:peptidoglycan biosynthesis protein MviN/MurJ (putative lipid II flippase)
VQLFGAARVGLLVRPSRGWRDDPEAAAVTRRLARSVGVAASPAAAMYVLLAIAGSVPGGVFVVQLSYAVLFALSYVSARAVSMAALPGLARAAHAGDTVKFGSAWREGAYYALLSGTPLLVMLAVLAGPTADLLANGELRGSAVIGPLAACLAIVAVAQLISGISDLGSQALYARLDDRVPRQAALAAFGVKLAVAALSLTVPAGGARLVWLVAAIFAGELASAALVLVRLRRVMRPERFLEPRALGSVLLAGLAMVPVAVAVRWVQRSYGGGHLTDLGILCAGGLVALAAYILVVRATAAGPIVRRS